MASPKSFKTHTFNQWNQTQKYFGLLELYILFYFKMLLKGFDRDQT